MKNLAIDYYNKYLEKILPILEELEPERVKIYNKIKSYIIYSISFILISALVFIGFIIFTEVTREQIIFCAIILSITIISLALASIPLIHIELEKSAKSFMNKVKSRCLDTMLSLFDGIKNEYGRQIIPTKELDDTGLFALYDTIYVDDTFSGKYKDTLYKIMECELVTSSREDKITSFKGVIIQIKANKQIKNTTFVATKEDYTSKKQSPHYYYYVILMIIIAPLIIFYNLFMQNLTLTLIAEFILLFAIAKYRNKSLKNKEIINQIKLEDPKFNNSFIAYSSDEIEGRYLLTTAFLERFLNLKTAFGTKKIKCAFHNEYLTIAISTTKDLFEFGNICTDLRKQDYISSLYNEINAIYKIIDHFKLDQKTGL